MGSEYMIKDDILKLNDPVSYNKGGHRFYEIHELQDNEMKTFHYPSVTSILSLVPSPNLEIWKQKTKNHQSIMLNSALKGNMIHHKVASFLAEKFDLAPPSNPLSSRQKELLVKIMLDDKKYEQLQLEINLSFSLFMDWYKKERPEVYAVESPVHSHLYQYAGTIDLIASVRKAWYIIELKTNDYMHEKYKYQASAYQVAWKEFGPFKIFKRGLLNIVASFRKTIVNYDFTELPYKFESFLVYREKFKQLMGK